MTFAGKASPDNSREKVVCTANLAQYMCICTLASLAYDVQAAYVDRVFAQEGGSAC